MKKLLILGLVLVLAGCGGYHKAKRERGKTAPRKITQPVAITPGARPIKTSAKRAPVAKQFARGPLQTACMASDRKARSRALCGCIQAVANQTLNNAQQARAATFYVDPHRAQQVRTSDKPGDKRFWETYSGYAGKAKRSCR